MSAPPDDLGPAFPWKGISGMTLRDWFASQALGAIMRNPGGWEWYAQQAYEMADFMLKVRARRPHHDP